MGKKEEQTRHPVTPGLFGIKVRFRGVFDLLDYYRWVYYWLDDQGYVPDEMTLEKKYIERRKPPIKNYEIEWQAEKKISNYFTYKIKLLFLIVAVKPTKIQVEGEEVEAEKGDAHLWVNAHVETPKWEDMGLFHGLYARFIAYRRLRREKVNLYKDVYMFQDDAKRYLGINQ